MQRVLVGEIRSSKAISTLVSIVGDVKIVHSLDRHLFGQFLYLDWILCACNQLLFLVGIEELPALAKLPQFQLLDRHPIFA